MSNQYVLGPLTFISGSQTQLSGSLDVIGNVNFGQNGNIPGVWTIGSPLIVPRRFLAGAGTQNEALAFGGNTVPSNVDVSCTEEYNGSLWSAGGAMITARQQLGGVGTQNASLAFGGYYPGNTLSCTEEYDGTSWIARGAMITARFGLGGAGTANEALAFGGSDAGLSIGNYSTCTEEYDGTSWSTGGSLSNATVENGGAGTQNAALSIGGRYTYTCTEEYDGAAWSAGGSLAFDSYRAATGGTSPTDAFTAGFTSNNTQVYDGTTWTTSGKINVAQPKSGAGNKNAGLAFGGYGVYASTEEYSPGCNDVFQSTFSYNSTLEDINTTGSLSVGYVYPSTLGITGGNNGISAWKTASPLITGRYGLAGAGFADEGLVFGGATTGPFLACTEEYNSFSWSTGGALIAARFTLAGAGSQNAALGFGGQTPVGAGIATCTEEYDGTSWSAGGALILGRSSLAGAGTQNAGLAFGGVCNGSPFITSCAEEYDGAAWSAAGALITARFALAGAGTQNAGLAFGGYLVSSSPLNYLRNSNDTEEYNGTVWTRGGNLNVPRCRLAGAGNSDTVATAFGGTFVCNVSYTERYDGTVWTVKANMITGRTCLAGIDGVLAVGGVTPAAGTVPLTEKYLPAVCDNAPFTALKYDNSCGNTSANSLNTLTLNSCWNTNISSVLSTTISSTCCINLSAYKVGLSAPLSTCIQTGLLGIAAGTSISGSTAVTGNVSMCANLLGGSGTWSTGGALILARQQTMPAGTQNSALAASGNCAIPNATTPNTEEYDGSSWSSGGAVITARFGGAGMGTQNSALIAGGNPVGSVVTCTEEYDGSTWSSGGALIQCRFGTAGAGTQNAGLVFAGATPSVLSATEEYDGATWTSGGNLINARRNIGGTSAGTQNEAAAFGGFCGPLVACTEEYNGTSWSTGGALIVSTDFNGGAGTQNSALTFGGRNFPSCTQMYDGAVWIAGGSLSCGRYTVVGGGGSNTCVVAFGGLASPVALTLACTEEYNAAFGPVKTFDYSNSTGITTVSCLIETSAQRYKDNVQELNSQLDKINQLKPVEFDWKNSRRHDIGFIAEEVANVYPEVVNKNEAGEVEGISYSKMVAALVKAMQEQQQQIAELTKKIGDLENK